MNILLVQPYDDNAYSYKELYKEIKEITASQFVDLIVFPECFMYLEESGNRWNEADALSEYFEKPVMIGFSTEFGSEELYYANVNNKDGDTYHKSYVKNSTAVRVMHDFYWKNINELFAPIILQGKKIQAYICHDMFYPLLTERLEREGLDVLINLTGGNVKMSKWCNILKGRSIELNAPVLCTMANRVTEKQPSDRIAYVNGKRLRPFFTQGNGKVEHAFSIFSLTESNYIEESTPYYSDKCYKKFTVSINREADCTIDLIEQEIDSPLNEMAREDHSFRLTKDDETIHVHCVGLDNLYDRIFVFNEVRHEGDQEVFIYLTDEIVDEDTMIALLKLRVIENRIAAIVAAPNLFIGAKTNRYKDVQLFKPTDGVIGFDLAHMYGFDSVYEKNRKSIQGLNVRYKDKYEALIDLD